MDTIDELLGSLKLQIDSPFPFELSTRIDAIAGIFVCKWRELQAGSDPYNDYEEYYRLDLPLQPVRDLVQHASDSKESSSQRIAGKGLDSYVHYDDYSGTVGGTGKSAWNTNCYESSYALDYEVQLTYVPGEPIIHLKVIYDDSL